MTDLIQKAIAKVDEEAEKMGGTYARLLASHVIDHYLHSDDNAQMVLDKTLSDAYGKIKSKARNQATGGCAVIDDETIYEWLRNYYGFGQGQDKSNSNIVSLFDLI